MSKRNLPVLFSREKIYRVCREYCKNTTKTIVTADDMVWLFPGRADIKRSSKDFAPWVILKRDISVFMITSEMARDWVQCSPKSPHSQRQWKRRTQQHMIGPTEAVTKKRGSTCGTKCSRSVSLIGNRNNRYCNGDPEPWESRLARYREVCNSLIVVENGGMGVPVKDYLTPEEVVV